LPINAKGEFESDDAPPYIQQSTGDDGPSIYCRKLTFEKQS
jgi:hypothetical protein